MLNEKVYRICRYSKRLIADDNPDEKILYSQFSHDGYFYNGHLNRETGEVKGIIPDEQSDEKWARVSIPCRVLDEGYNECSSFAALFNKHTPAELNVRLVDKEVADSLARVPIEVRPQRFTQVDVAGDTFEVDVVFQEIRKIDDPLVRIPFEAMEYDAEEGYNFDYDKKNQRQADHFSEDNQVIRVHVGEMVKLDPVRIANQYGIPVDQLPARDISLRNSNELVDKRIKYGILPITSVWKRNYEVYMHSREMRNTEDPSDVIRLDKKKGNSIIFYDCRLNKQVDFDGDDKKLPEHILLVLLPTKSILDGVEFAREKGMNAADAAVKTPLGKISARVYPLTEIRDVKKAIQISRMQYNASVASRQGLGL